MIPWTVIRFTEGHRDSLLTSLCLVSPVDGAEDGRGPRIDSKVLYGVGVELFQWMAVRASVWILEPSMPVYVP